MKAIPSEMDADIQKIAEEIAFMLILDLISLERNDRSKIYYLEFGEEGIVSCSCLIPMREVANMSSDTIVGYYLDRLIDKLDNNEGE